MGLLLNYMYTTRECLIMKEVQAVRLTDTLRYESKYAFRIPMNPITSKMTSPCSNQSRPPQCLCPVSKCCRSPSNQNIPSHNAKCATRIHAPNAPKIQGALSQYSIPNAPRPVVRDSLIVLRLQALHRIIQEEIDEDGI